MNLASILVTMQKDLKGFNVVCFPTEGEHFELTHEEFIEEYPQHKASLETTICKIMVHTNHNYLALI